MVIRDTSDQSGDRRRVAAEIVTDQDKRRRLGDGRAADHEQIAGATISGLLVRVRAAVAMVGERGPAGIGAEESQQQARNQAAA